MPRPDQGQPGSESLQEQEQQQTRAYLCFFVHRFLGFRLQEAQALTQMAMQDHTSGLTDSFNLPAIEWQLPEGGGELSPFRSVCLPSDAVAASIARRSMLIKARPLLVRQRLL